MVFDPSIFFQAAQMQNANRPDVFANFANAYMTAKDKRQSGPADLLKLAETAYLKKAAGLEVTPEEDALAMGFDKIQTSKLGFDPSSGQSFQRQRSIFDQVAAPAAMPAAMPAPRPSQMATAADDAALDNLPSPFPAGFQNGDIQAPPSPKDFNTVQLNPQQLAELIGGQGPYEAAAPEYTTDGPRAAQPASPALQTVLNLRAKAEMEPDRARRNDLLKKADELEADAALKREESVITKQQAQPKIKQSVIKQFAEVKNKMELIDEAIKMSNNLSSGVGSATSFIPGTPAANLESYLKSIGATAAFDALQEMRDNSPTGGALGSIAVQELELLKSAQAPLSQSQSPELLKKNLERFKKQLVQSYKNVAAAYEKDYGEKMPMDFGQEAPRQIQTPAGTVTIKRID